MNKKTIEEIFENLCRALARLEKENHDLNNPPAGQHRKLLGQIIVDGRAITNILQNLRGSIPNFDEWYQPYVTEMENDELLRFFYKVRSEILKKGDDHIVQAGGHLDSRQNFTSISDKGIEIQIRQPNGEFRHEFIPKPPNAKHAFLNDREGGCGWVVVNPDGSETKKYVNVPSDIYVAFFKFRNPPKKHLGRDISKLGAEEMCDLYVKYLVTLVKEAKNTFQ
jgi:hypothetical protein